MKEKRGQAWGFDLMIAMVIFLGTMIFFYFYAINYPSEEDETFSKLQRQGFLIADSLMTEGSPRNWDENNVIRIGLLSDEVINQTKLETFANMDYDETKSLFRIKDEYYVTMDQPFNIGGAQVAGIGQDYAGATNLAKVTRVVVYNNSIKTFYVYTWN